jgi:hypothetical protein
MGRLFTSLSCPNISISLKRLEKAMGCSNKIFIVIENKH